MTERAIVFSGPMVRAILAGRKTVTRRVVKPQPYFIESSGRWVYEIPRARIRKGCTDRVADASQRWYDYLLPEQWAYRPGDRLWLREAWQYADWTEDGEPFIRYRADDVVLLRSGDEKSSDAWATLSDPSNYEIDGKAADRRWRSPIHMPRWASRITLEVVDVRVERLHEISPDDCKAEGVPTHLAEHTFIKCYRDPFDRADKRRLDFRKLWDSINGKSHPWSSNPWVWRVEFKRVEV